MMIDNAWPLIDFAFLVLATFPLSVLGVLWALSAADRSPRWIYLGSKWTTILLFLPWLVVATGLVSDIVNG
jgi:hypothetical protein